MNKETFIKQVAPLRGMLLGNAQRLTNDVQQAEDIVQETMLRLWQQRESLDSHPNLKALALGIMRNCYIDEWRRQRKRNQNASETNIIGNDSDEKALEYKDLTQLMIHIVDHLPPLQRQIFRMKEIEGLESDEIQQITGCSAEALRKNLSRARMRIREDFVKITSRRKTR